MQIVNLSRDRLVEMERVFREALGVSSAGTDDDALWSYFDAGRSWLAIDEDDRVAGLAGGFVTRLVLPGGGIVSGGGVPWVGVRVDRHGTGVGRALMEHQIADAAARGDGFLVLNSSEYPIYGRYGYGPTGRWWSVKIDPRRVRWREGAPVPGRVTVEDAPDARERIVDCYRRSFGAWPGEIDRHEGHWTRRLSPREKSGERRSWALLQDDAGTVVAAAHYTPWRSATRAAASRTGWRSTICSAWTPPRRRPCAAGCSGAVSSARCRAIAWIPARPCPTPWRIRACCAPPSWPTRRGCGSSTSERVLGGRATLADGTLVVRVLDPLVEAVDGSWRLLGDGERLRVERSDEEAGVTLGIDLLASLLFAHDSASRLAAAGRLRGTPAALTELDRLLAWPRPAWSSHMF